MKLFQLQLGRKTGGLGGRERHSEGVEDPVLTTHTESYTHHMKRFSGCQNEIGPPHNPS